MKRPFFLPLLFALILSACRIFESPPIPPLGGPISECFPSRTVQVWEDVNGNGQFDEGEQPLKGVAVTIYPAGDTSRSFPAETGEDGIAKLHGIGDFGPKCDELEVDVSVPRDYLPTTPTHIILAGLSSNETLYFGMISQFATPTALPSTSIPAAPIEHHIGVRVINSIGEFYNRTTGNKFVPRGMNYIRLAQQTTLDGSSTFGHALFDPGKYDSSRVSVDLQKMHTDGYNVIRVFLSPDTIGSADGGLSPAYINNIADFLTHAKQNHIYVMFTLDWIPGGKYGSILNEDCCTTFTLMNANYLPPAGLKANQVFYQDFIIALLALNAPTEYIYSYQIRNEMFYDTVEPPLSFNSGIVKTANGKSYDMSITSDKKMMVEENLVFWIDEMRTSILEIDPTALVSVGFFQPQEPNPSRIGDQRLAVTEPAIWQSTADFIDLHPYAGFELNFKQHVENYGINGMQEKPIIMGEFGSDISQYPSIQQAAQAFVDWQIESCKYGFDGWLFWTWDSAEQSGMFNALMDDGVINSALAPINRDDPCSP